MRKSESISHSFIWQHRLIGFFRNIDFPGFRKLSLLLPKWILPHPEKVGEHILTLPSGLRLWIDPSKDQGVERSLFETGTYERGTLSFISSHLNERQTFVDIGANIGLMSLTAQKAVGEKGQVWAFEANPKTFEILEKNIELNEAKGIRSFACGLGRTKETQVLYDNWSINRGAASTVVKSQSAQGTEIQILPLDEVTIGQGIHVDLMKIDVEGMELQVLEGAKNTILKDQPILIVEFSIERNETNGRQALYDALVSYDIYTLYKLAGGKERDSKLVKIQAFSEIPTDDNVFCLPNKNPKK